MSTQRGPDPDFNPASQADQAQLLNLISALVRRKPVQFNNGDDGSNTRKWHLTLASASVILAVVGTAWKLSDQISSQFATQAVRIEAIREHQREQDDRTTRIEQQLQQLSIERARSPSPSS